MSACEEQHVSKPVVITLLGEFIDKSTLSAPDRLCVYTLLGEGWWRVGDCADSTEPDLGLELTNLKVMT